VRYPYYLLRFPEFATPLQLGRHIEHDIRSLAYRFEYPKKLAQESVLWPDTSPVLDQGETNSCTGNASAQLLNTEMFAPVLQRLGKGSYLDEAVAMEIYSLATHLDGFPASQDYPPNDNGSTGLGAAKAMQQLGYIDSYQHCFDMAGYLAAIQKQPLLVGTVWTQPMFKPDSTGLVTIGPVNDKTVLGGHEYLGRGVNFEKQLLTFRSSWGESYGRKGEFDLSFEDFGTLFKNDGDAIVCHGVGLQ
jgi:hypothetical protein